jgi:hypothetical protein
MAAKVELAGLGDFAMGPPSPRQTVGLEAQAAQEATKATAATAATAEGLLEGHLILRALP